MKDKLQPMGPSEEQRKETKAPVIDKDKLLERVDKKHKAITEKPAQVLYHGYLRKR